jgi:ankyrin repeat protein
MAPEIYKVGGFIDANTVDTLKYDCAVDLWSLGCVIYKLLTGQIPFQLQNHSRELAWFCNGKCPFPVDPLAPRVSAEGILFIKNLLHPAPLERLTAKGGLQHSWILNDHESPRMKFPNAPGATLPFQTSDQQGVTNNSIWTATTTAVSTWETALEAQPGFCRERFEGISLEEKRNMAQRLFNAAGYNPINGGIFTFEDALVTAAQIGDDVIVHLLLEAGVKPDHQCWITTGRTVLNSRMTPLVVAAQRGHELIVQMLLHYGANLNLKGTSTTAKRAYNSHTALHAAIESEHESVARLLIEAGASVEAKDYFGNLPIHSAAEAGQCATLELLLDRGANIQAKAGIMYDQGTPLHTAVRRKQKEAVRILIERQAPLEARSGSNRTALHEAVTWASEEIVEMLVAAGADLTARDRNKRTPFQLVQCSMIDSRTEINNIERLVNPSKKKTP